MNLLLSYHLVQDQRPTLTITPELKQSIHILSLSGYELMQYLQEQAMENPVLEIEAGYDGYRYGKKRGTSTSSIKYAQDPLWNVKPAQDSMEIRLQNQLRLLSLPADVYRAAAFLAGNLNDDGYLEAELSDLRGVLKFSEDLLGTALHQLQSLEPAGIACRDLRECLLLQIVRDPEPVPYAEEIVDGYLPLLANGSFDQIALALRINKEQVRSASLYIRSLNPRPGLSMNIPEPHYIVPDAVVRCIGDDFTVALHPSAHPRLSVNKEYREWIKIRQTAEASSFLSSCFKSAHWIERCIEMRKLTLVRVITAMMEEQREFLARGVKGLRPMNLFNISSMLGMHESTVSRAIHDKFVLTPHGVFPLKFFFAASLSTADGSGASSRSVKLRIKELVDAENKSKPYSDQKIVELLFAEGIQLSRRTVTKYREELKILSSTYRRRRL
ncbi:RNA polymerase, sigma 54 subunit, RpoN/SigL [Paenibacillus uliginis N3/975]|uniref:RNA polymerase, sigma 54 subunit, RpoN/SigL n=1 Tax=Paenibacillus uliginis N3/975 TaxID=1313296 RepID=A0A1X7GNA5_9BACL|nr:RNA polymerase factor sigma-54 [Paenibacillus uliginis]SMF72314.1 RNA polymerase, sigma 54 subunit, RpoN/SigL [Paenibacillus uliginis N3/975]